MRKKFKSGTIKFSCWFLTLYSFLAIPFMCFAETNTSKVNSLLQEIYAENPQSKAYEQAIRDDINYRLRIAREHNFSEKVYSTSPQLNTEASAGEVFEKIYDSNFWESTESKSGPGSQIDSTENIRKSLPELFKKYDIKSVLDAPCGDYNWMKTVEKPGIKYIGGDIVPKIVRENNKKFKNENTSFQVLDITSDNLPKSDMIICRDCLQHLSNKNVKKALKNFKASGSKYLLTTNYPWTIENYDIVNGDFRTLNLTQKPFELPKQCTEKIKESSAEGNWGDKYLYLYKLDDINTEKLFAPQVKTNTIPIAMALDENYLYPTLVAITSAMENSNYKNKYNFYIMHSPDLSEKSKSVLKLLQEKYDNCTVNLIDMQNKFKSAYTDSRITTPAYYRLLLSDLLPELEKIIWIDGDTLTLKDLGEMINIDMDGYCYKGFLDFPCHEETLKQFGVSNDHYTCSGVMLVNLSELRKNNMVNKFNDFILKNNNKLIQHDQTVINAICADKIGVLPAKFGIWNLFPTSGIKGYCNILKSSEKYTFQELSNASLKPAVLHCVSKPWAPMDTRDFTDIWWHYAEKTDFFSEIQQKYFIPEGVYTITPAHEKNKALDILGASNLSGAKLQLWDKNNTQAQKFKVTYDKNGYYTIGSLCSNKLIDVPGASQTATTPLWQHDPNNTDAQKWYIFRGADGSYQIISRCNGMCMDMRYGKTENGTVIQCYPQNGTNAQKFEFTKTK